jgi:hydrogenase-4 component B
VVLATGQVASLPLWTIPGWGSLVVRMDRLGALFVVVAGLVFLPVSIFCADYLPRYLGRYSLRTFGGMYLGLYASVVLILIAGDVLLFLFVWEAMSILSYLLVAYEHEEEGHAQAGYAMLAIGEAGTLGAALGLLILTVAAGSADFSALKAGGLGLGAGARWAVFLLTFFGFGVKAGLVPTNSWLPRAHPVAPGNVSALLSGVVLNLGIYGILRVNLDLLPPRVMGMGLIALAIGTVSAVVGILYATTENDLKVMLAHSSTENMGIVAAGLGAGFVFTAAGQPSLAVIAFVAALYHLTNHSMYKSLLFLEAAAVDARVGTRDLDKLGGLIRKMPGTAALFLVGALSIAALPPLNGFVSEWLMLQTVLRSVELPSIGAKLVFAVCGAGLALTAGLAVTCFVKAFAMGFLGMSRSPEARRATEARGSALAPGALLAALCLGLGVLPTYVIPVFSEVLSPLTHASAVEALVPPFFAGSPGHANLPPGFAAEFHDLGAGVGQSFLPGRGLVVLHRGGTANPVVFAMSTSYSLAGLVLLLGIVYAVVGVWIARRRRVVRRQCWDGGIRRLLPEMTYTATGFSNPVRVIFDAVFRPTLAGEGPETVATHFRMAIRQERRETYIVDRVLVHPARQGAMAVARQLARMHNGRVNAYIGYVLAALLLVLLAAWLGGIGS